MHLGFTIKRDHDNSPSVFINIAKPKVSRQRTQLASNMRGPTRKAAWRNMMVAVINALLGRIASTRPAPKGYADTGRFMM